MNTEANQQPGLVAHWAVHTASLDDAQQERARLLLIHGLLERLERADDELRADVLRIMGSALRDVAAEAPRNAAERRTEDETPGRRLLWFRRRNARHVA